MQLFSLKHDNYRLLTAPSRAPYCARQTANLFRVSNAKKTFPRRAAAILKEIHFKNYCKLTAIELKRNLKKIDITKRVDGTELTSALMEAVHPHNPRVAVFTRYSSAMERKISFLQMYKDAA
jgi:hypothetical protein